MRTIKNTVLFVVIVEQYIHPIVWFCAIMPFCMKIPLAIMLWIVSLVLIALCSANSKNSSNKVSLIWKISEERDFIWFQWLIEKVNGRWLPACIYQEKRNEIGWNQWKYEKDFFDI